MTHAALRTSRTDRDRVWITGRVARDDAPDAEALLAELAPVLHRHGAVLRPLGGRGESLLLLPGHPSGAVTDSDPFFEDFHPWLRVLPTAPSAAGTAERLTALLLDARAALVASPVNVARSARGLPPLDVLTTKWSGSREPIPCFRGADWRRGGRGHQHPALPPGSSGWRSATCRPSTTWPRTCGPGWRWPTS